MIARLSVDVYVTPLFRIYIAYSHCENTCWWTVWLGWHSAEKISAEPKGWLNRVRNPVWSAKAKASLIGFLIRWNTKAKAWLSELP